MTDDYTDYTKFTGDDANVEETSSMNFVEDEPETIEDLAAQTNAPDAEVEIIEDVFENPVAEEGFEPEVEETEGRLMRIDVDSSSKLNVRSTPSVDRSTVLAQLHDEDLVTLVRNVDDEWLLIECEKDGEKIRGYVKKMYTAEV